jgi:hypothetical protein
LNLQRIQAGLQELTGGEIQFGSVFLHLFYPLFHAIGGKPEAFVTMEFILTLLKAKPSKRLKTRLILDIINPATEYVIGCHTGDRWNPDTAVDAGSKKLALESIQGPA